MATRSWTSAPPAARCDRRRPRGHPGQVSAESSPEARRAALPHAPPGRLEVQPQRAPHCGRTADHRCAALRELYHREPQPFQTLNFPVGTQQFAHSDTIHFNSAPASFMAGVWVAMEDIDMDNGPLIYYPGSQKLPEYTMAHVGVPGVATNYPKYEEFIQKVIRDFDLKPDYGIMKKGQVFIWSANLIHGGSMMRKPLRSRHSQVTHFYFKGCRYYTPLDTEGTRVLWRQPEWIPLV